MRKYPPAGRPVPRRPASEPRPPQSAEDGLLPDRPRAGGPSVPGGGRRRRGRTQGRGAARGGGGRDGHEPGPDSPPREPGARGEDPTPPPSPGGRGTRRG